MKKEELKKKVKLSTLEKLARKVDLPPIAKELFKNNEKYEEFKKIETLNPYDPDVYGEMYGYFSEDDRSSTSIVFVYSGKSFSFTKSKTTTNPNEESVVKIIGGLNHFLTYWFLENKDVYDRICEIIMSSLIDLLNDLRIAHNAVKYRDVIEECFVKWATLNDELLLYIIEYVKVFYLSHKSNSKAINTITDDDGLVLTVFSVAMKFSHIFLSVIRGKTTNTEIAPLFVNKLLAKILELASDDIENTEECYNNIDNYCGETFFKQWNKSTSESYRDLFLAVGKHDSFFQLRNRIRLLEGLTKYTIPTFHPKVFEVRKYAEESNVTYFTFEKDYRDFAFVNKNLYGYINRTINNIVDIQDKKEPFGAIINSNSSLLDVTSDNTNTKRELSFLTDRKKFQFENRKKNILDIFEKSYEELYLECNKDNNIVNETLKDINLNKHPLNNFILNKILLSLTGESSLYAQLLGQYSKVLISLFRIKASRLKEPEMIRSIQFIGTKASDVYCSSREYLDNYLNSNGLHMYENEKDHFMHLIRIYTTSEGVDVTPDISDFVYFKDRMNNPSFIRNLLFPDKYEYIPPMENPYDGTEYTKNKDKIQKIVNNIYLQMNRPQMIKNVEEGERIAN